MSNFLNESTIRGLKSAILMNIKRNHMSVTMISKRVGEKELQHPATAKHAVFLLLFSHATLCPRNIGVKSSSSC